MGINSIFHWCYLIIYLTAETGGSQQTPIPPTYTAPLQAAFPVCIYTHWPRAQRQSVSERLACLHLHTSASLLLFYLLPPHPTPTPKTGHRWTACTTPQPARVCASVCLCKYWVCIVVNLSKAVFGQGEVMHSLNVTIYWHISHTHTKRFFCTNGLLIKKSTWNEKYKPGIQWRTAQRLLPFMPELSP